MKLEIVAITRGVLFSVVLGIGLFARPAIGSAQTLLDPELSVTTVVTGLNQSIAMAFLGPDDFLVTEKASGQVKRVVNGVVTGVVLDLAVNSGSERGLLGIALHPDFPATPFVYLYNTESSTGVDTTDLASVPLLGNRVDRFRWNGTALTFDRNIIRLRVLPERPQQRRQPESPGAARQPQRRRHPLRPRRQAVHHHRRQRPARLAAEQPRRSIARRRLRWSGTG